MQRPKSKTVITGACYAGCSIDANFCVFLCERLYNAIVTDVSGRLSAYRLTFD